MYISLPIWLVIFQSLGIVLAPSFAVIAGLILFRKDRGVDTGLKETQQQDTYFKQAVELASQYREELGRQRAVIESLEKTIKEQELECDRKIKLLQEQINGLLSNLSSKSRKTPELERSDGTS